MKTVSLDRSSIEPRVAPARRFGLGPRALLFALLAVLALPATPGLAAKRAATPQARVERGFDFTDIRGNKVRQADYRGRWVLVNFWAPWCPLCLVEVPTLNRIDQSRDVAVVGIAMDYGPDRDNAMRMAQSMSFTNVMGGNRNEPDNAATQVGPVHFYPMSYLFNPKGERVATLMGPVTEGRLRQAMRSSMN